MDKNKNYKLGNLAGKKHSLLNHKCTALQNHNSVDPLVHCRSEAELELVLATGVKECHWVINRHPC